MRGWLELQPAIVQSIFASTFAREGHILRWHACQFGMRVYYINYGSGILERWADSGNCRRPPISYSTAAPIIRFRRPVGRSADAQSRRRGFAVWVSKYSATMGSRRGRRVACLQYFALFAQTSLGTGAVENAHRWWCVFRRGVVDKMMRQVRHPLPCPALRRRRANWFRYVLPRNAALAQTCAPMQSRKGRSR